MAVQEFGRFLNRNMRSSMHTYIPFPSFFLDLLFLGKYWFSYAILEYERLIDSSEIEISDYLKICNSIQANYFLYDSFVILHGTDTMAYTASALSFLLENLGKNVILTGAQVPLSCARNDAVENLLGALQISGTYLIPEVSLYFNHRLWRGNRSMKVSSVEFDAFKSFNLDPLIKIGCNIEVRWDLISKPVERQAFSVHQAMCENVGMPKIHVSHDIKAAD